MRSTLIFLKITSILFLLRVNLLQLIIKTQKPIPIKKKIIGLLYQIFPP